jgi:parvulin-like peptidyl-prolyl isomerase
MGSVGKFHRADMDPSFSGAAFALKVGGVSDVVETPFGFHVIKRTQ